MGVQGKSNKPEYDVISNTCRECKRTYKFYKTPHDRYDTGECPECRLDKIIRDRKEVE